MFSARAAIQTVHFEDSEFLIARWFSYLDILGSLSGPKSPAPLSFDIYWPQSEFAAEDEIDCLLGFTSRYIRILGNVATLVKECEPERLDEINRVRPNWIPTTDTEQKARSLLAALHDSRSRPVSPCMHRGPPSDDAEADDSLDNQEVLATNELYHWAGIIQVLRRTLNVPTDSDEVREAVSAVVEKLDMIRAGSSAEACLLFPMFTAGCEARDAEQRRKIMARLKDVESFGMRQVCYTASCPRNGVKLC
jgi:hypothetical protein